MKRLKLVPPIAKLMKKIWHFKQLKVNYNKTMKIKRYLINKWVIKMNKM
jgi:hypothetical protein